jgi:hypothetical protein
MTTAELPGRIRDTIIRQAWRLECVRPLPTQFSKPHLQLEFDIPETCALSLSEERLGAIVSTATQILEGRVAWYEPGLVF